MNKREKCNIHCSLFNLRAFCYSFLNISLALPFQNYNVPIRIFNYYLTQKFNYEKDNGY